MFIVSLYLSPVLAGVTQRALRSWNTAQLRLPVALAHLQGREGIAMAIQEPLLHVSNKNLKGMGLQKAKNHSTVALVKFRHHIIEKHHRPVSVLALNR